MKTLAFFFVLMAGLLQVEAKSPEKVVTLPELKIGTVTYYEVKVSLRNGNEARIMHRDGTRTVNPLLLPENLRTELGYNAEDARKAMVQLRQEAAVQIQAVRNEQAAEAIQALLKDPATRPLTITVINVLPNGILGRWGPETVFIETPTADAGYVDDSTYRFTTRQVGTFSYITVLGASKSVKKYRDVKWIFEMLKHPGASLPE